MDDEKGIVNKIRGPVRADRFFEDRLGEWIYKIIKRSFLHDFFLYVSNMLKRRMPESMYAVDLNCILAIVFVLMTLSNGHRLKQVFGGQRQAA